MQSGNSQLKNKISQIFTNLWDFLFPINCISCGVEGIWLCQSCLNKIEPNNEQICPICKKISVQGQIHRNCQSSSSLDGLIAASKYSDKIIKNAILNFKYRGAKDISQSLSWLIIDHIKDKQISFFKEVDIVIPIPLHKKKYIQRGFNQTNLIAEDICNYFEWKFGDYLQRIKYTQTQTKLNEKQRQINIEGVFKMKVGVDLKNKNIILVDDVITTGSTLQECAKVLKQAGATKVWGLAVAQD